VTRALLLIGITVLLLAACGSGGKSDADQVKQNWTTFFAAKTPVSQRVALLQDGARFKSAIASLASNPLASQLSAKVSKVTVEGNKATVAYAILFGNTVAFGNLVGSAYKQHGKWLVGYAGLCRLIEQQGTTPAACKS
jgi:hypothetical protein